MIRLDRENTNTKEWWEKYYSGKLNKKPSRRRTEEAYKFVLPYLEDGKTLLDVGCGMGWGSALIKKHKPKMKITGIDISEEAIKFCRENHKKIRFLQFDFAKESWDDDSPRDYDYIIILEIMEHLEYPMRSFYFFSRAFLLQRIFISVPYRPEGKDSESTHINIFDWADFPNACLIDYKKSLKMMIDKTYEFEKWKTIPG